MRMSRRKLLSGAGSFSIGAGLAAPVRAATRVHLRLLETSDLHMFARDWDYYHGKADPTVGLDRVAGLIANARAQAPNALLFDNGDIIQGNPLGDYVALADPAARSRIHPMFRAMNLLGYDAATVGNHEFNYGLAFVERALAGANFPFVCANLERADGAAWLPPIQVLDRTVVDEDGRSHAMRIGVIGFTPPQIMTWDRTNLEGRLRCGDIVAAARRLVPQLRAQCDVVVALSHSGISSAPALGGDENASLYLAGVPGIDAIFTGHSHRVFPGPDYTTANGIDAERGTLHGIPATMPGFWGSHLGIIDLSLARDGERWAVDHFATEARPIYAREGATVRSFALPSATIDAAIEPEHTQVNLWVAEPIGRIAAPVHSFFLFAGYDPCAAIVNAAQTAYARALLAGTQHEGLPVLSAAAPFKAGYTPDAFIDIAAGPIARRDVADLYLYPNTVSAVRVSGALVREWLEQSARVFNHIDPQHEGPQPLLDRRVPTYNFDVISGVTYEIDPRQPARYDQNGSIVNPQARRIVNLRFAGAPIDEARDFIVVTNNYRADGGGHFPGLDGSRTILRAPDANREAVLRYFSATPEVAVPQGNVWRFAGGPVARSLWFDSAASATGRMADVPGLRIASGATAGFARFEIDLG